MQATSITSTKLLGSDLQEDGTSEEERQQLAAAARGAAKAADLKYVMAAMDTDTYPDGILNRGESPPRAFKARRP